MLAVSDTSLALLAIGATRIPARARGRSLQQLAQRLEPPPKPTTRQQRWRERQRNGRAVFKVEVDVERVVGVLIETGRIGERDAEQREQVERALGHVIEDWCERWRA